MGRDRRKLMEAHRARGKVWFHYDGGTERRYAESGGEPTPTDQCIFFRDDPPTLEMYAVRQGQWLTAQVFPSRAQLESLRDFLSVYLEDPPRFEGGPDADD